MPRPSIPSHTRPSFLVALAALLVAACNTTDPPAETGGGGAGAGTASGGGGAGAGTATGGSGGASGDCPQATSMLDVSTAIGAGDGYEKPTLTWKCDGDMFVVDGNGIPHYSFIQMTPNPLVAQAEHYEIPRDPQVAAQVSEIPLLGVAGFAVNGQPFFGPNEAAQPADEAFGDPVYNGLMDPCLGHTAFAYHYHALTVKCLNPASLVEEPWMNPDPPSDEASPIVAWALDGFPVRGPLECADAACSGVVEMKSGYAQIGDPKMNAWDAYEWQPHDGDATYLDECNGHVGPSGDYHYHATAGFPYILGCYRGTVGGGTGAGGGGAGGGGAGAGGGMMGPQPCTSDADCVGACPPGSMGCDCHASPMGDVCVPTCQTAADCPELPGMTFDCNMGVCAP